MCTIAVAAAAAIAAAVVCVVWCNVYNTKQYVRSDAACNRIVSERHTNDETVRKLVRTSCCFPRPVVVQTLGAHSPDEESLSQAPRGCERSR